MGSWSIVNENVTRAIDTTDVHAVSLPSRLGTRLTMRYFWPWSFAALRRSSRSEWKVYTGGARCRQGILVLIVTSSLATTSIVSLTSRKNAFQHEARSHCSPGLDVGFFLDTTENYLLHTASIRPHGRRRSRPAHAGIFSLPRTTIRGARPCNDGSKARPRGRAAARAADLDAFNYRYLRIALATTRYLSTSPCSSTAQYDAYAPAARQHHMHPPRSVRGPASSSCWLCSVQRSKPLYDSAAQRVRCPTHALRDGAQHSMTHGLGER